MMAGVFETKTNDYLKRLKDGEQNPWLIYELCRKWRPSSSLRLWKQLDDFGVDLPFDFVAEVFVEWQEAQVKRFDDEVAFRNEVAKALRRHGHLVYFHEGDESKFSISNSLNGYVDLYVQTASHWEYHDTIPVIGIETKLAEKGFGWLRKAMDQIAGYEADTSARYFIGTAEVPKPSLFLLATDHSVYGDHLYRWQLPGIDKAELTAGWVMLTEAFDRLLWERGVCLLRKGYFYTNKFGAPKRYDLSEKKAQSA